MSTPPTPTAALMQEIEGLLKLYDEEKSPFTKSVRYAYRLADALRRARDRIGELEKDIQRANFCPNCGESTIQHRGGDTYCENCGWPDERRE